MGYTANASTNVGVVSSARGVLHWYHAAEIYTESAWVKR